MEAVIAIALLGMVGLGVFTGSGVLTKVGADSNRITEQSKLIQSFVESIKADPSLNQIDFSGDEETFLDPAKLPIGYSADYLGPRDNHDHCDSGVDMGDRTGCDSLCTGYIGYRISPLGANTPGLLRVKVRVYNLKNTICGSEPKSPDIKDIEFVMQAK